MKHLSQSILELLKDSAAVAGQSHDEGLATATADTVLSLQADGLIDAQENWVYDALLSSMVQSGVLKLGGKSDS